MVCSIRGTLWRVESRGLATRACGDVDFRVRFGMCWWTRGRRPWACGGGKALVVSWAGGCSLADDSEGLKERREGEFVVLGEF